MDPFIQAGMHADMHQFGVPGSPFGGSTSTPEPSEDPETTQDRAVRTAELFWDSFNLVPPAVGAEDAERPPMATEALLFGLGALIATVGDLAAATWAQVARQDVQIDLAREQLTMARESLAGIREGQAQGAALLKAIEEA